MKSRSREIGSLHYRIGLKFDRRLDSTAAEEHNSRGYETLRDHDETTYQILKWGPGGLFKKRVRALKSESS